MKFCSSQTTGFMRCCTLPASYVVLLAAFCFLSMVLQETAQGQTDIGHIVGTVTDQSGAVVAHATVRITNQSTLLAQTVNTNENGYYTSLPLSPGRYDITVESAGFQSSSRRNILLDAAATMTVDAVLPVGAASTNVTVEAAPPVLDQTDAQIGNTVDTRAAQQLPLNGRSALALATIMPGVESAVGAVSQGFANRGTAVSAIRISGGVTGLNNNLLDGINNLQAFTGEIGINIKADAVGEYRIMTGIIPAQFGYTSGGVINVITRSGGASYHGSVYEYLRNDAMDAVIAFPRPTFGKPELRFNNYGGTFGGPVLRDKLFGFFNYEGNRLVSDTPSYTTVPTAQEYQGDFSDLATLSNGTCTQIKIYDPATATTTGSRTQFQGNVIPSGRLDSAAVAYQKMVYPQANNNTGAYNSCTHANNYIISPKLNYNETQWMGRADYQISAMDSIFGRYALYRATQNNAAGYSPLFNRDDNDKIQNAVFSETHVFSPSLVNNARLGIERAYFTFLSATANKDIAGKIGIPNDTPYDGPLMGNGMIQTQGIIGFRATTLFQLQDDLTKSIKGHTLQLGASAIISEAYNNQTNASSSGTFNFTASVTAAGNNTSVVAGTGSAYASYLLGAVSNANIYLPGGSAYRKWQYAGYAQDNWHASRRLTIDAGLRYDYQPQAYEKNNKFENVDLSQPNPSNTQLYGLVQYAGHGYGSNFANENFNDWGPRFGFALTLTNDNKTVLRGGYALYFATTAEQYYDQSAGSSNGFNALTTNFNSSTPNGPAFQLSNGIPGPYSWPLGVAGGQTAFLGSAIYTIAPTQKDPSSQQYTLTLSRELPFSLVADLTYIGNHGRHFTLPTYNVNTLSPTNFSLGTAYLNASVANPYAGMVPGSLGAATITRANLLKPYPYYTSVYPNYQRGASYDGNYMYLTVQRRAQHGLQLVGAYTYGRLEDLPLFTSISTTPGAGISTSNGPQNPRNLKADYAVDTFDVRQRLTVTALYDLPIGKGQRFLSGDGWLDRILGGFQYNMVMTLESGRPLLISGASNQGIATRPNFNPGVSVSVSNPNRYKWFNPDAFINPPDYSFGNVPRTYSPVRGPGQQNFDMSLFKTIPLREKVHLELRLEAFNVLNKTNLQNPNTSFAAGAPADPSNPYLEGGKNTNSNFGVVTSANAARIVQIAGRITF